ncbi:MAG: LacI family DNA-binding transcriptional regulator [Desulfobacteraceae bacterium]|nr:LacI family DNA-binding transcriptional regulator [Desulfobacteraceae bacterium]
MSSKVTISDVAKEAGVSSQTVSRVVNRKGEISPETRKHVLEVIKRLGYRPSSIARSLATNHTLTLGLVVPDIANPFFPEIARGIEDVAWEEGYGVILCNTLENLQREEAAIRSLEDKRVDGIIVCSARLPDEMLLELLKPQRAVVLVNRVIPEQVGGMVAVDDVFGATTAVKHILANGRQSIGFLAGPVRSHSSRQRSIGLKQALAEAGIDPHPPLEIPCTPDVSGGCAAAGDLLGDHPEIDALVCYNDLVAVGALQACSERNLHVPQDVAVVGYDDIPLAALVRPALTTLRVCKYEIGADAARMLLRQIGEQKREREIFHKPELVIRESAPASGSMTDGSGVSDW